MRNINECKQLKLLPTELIIPRENQPRQTFDEYDLASLSESIKQNGILQPLSVKKNGAVYTLIAGERRLRAAKMAGIKKVPCIIFSCNDSAVDFFSIIENLQRSDLSFFEEAEAIHRLIEASGLSHREVAERLGIASSSLSNKLRILSLSEDIKRRINAASLTSRHARALLRLNENERDNALDYIIAHSLNLKQTEEYIESLINPAKPEPKQTQKSSLGDIRLFTNSFNRLVDTLVFSGIPAKRETKECRDYVEYKVKIPKPQAAAPEKQLRISV